MRDIVKKDFFYASTALVGLGLLYKVPQSHSVKIRTHSVVLLWTSSPSQRPLPDNTHHSQQTDIYARGGIRTRNPSKRAAYALDRADTGTGKISYHIVENTHTAKMTLVPVRLNIFHSTL